MPRGGRGGWRREPARCRGSRGARQDVAGARRDDRQRRLATERAAAAASRTVPSPPTTTTSGGIGRLREGRPRRLERARLDPRAAPVPARGRRRRPRRRSARAAPGRRSRDARGLTRISGVAEGRGSRRAHGPMLARPRCGLAAHDFGIPARLRLADDPQVNREPGKLENRPARTALPSPPSGDVPVRRRHSPEPGPSRFPHVLPCAPAGVTARRAPSATSWQEGAPLRTRHLGARAFIPVALAGAVLFSLAPSTPAAASTTTEAQQIVRIAKAQLGDPWRYGASRSVQRSIAPASCIYAYRRAGDGAAIHSTLPALGPRALPLVPRARKGQPHKPQDRRPRRSGAAARTSGSTSATARRSAR